MDFAAALAPAEPLTARELEVVRLVAEGLSNQQIAAALHVSPRTVQAHIARAMRKTGVRSRTGLAVSAIRAGLVPLFPDVRAATQP